MYCRAWPAAVAALALTCVVALGTLCLCDAVPPGDKKFVGVTLLNLQFSFVVAVGDAMSLDSARNVVTELSQVENLITPRITFPRLSKRFSAQSRLTRK
jgi:hypothetical protein